MNLRDDGRLFGALEREAAQRRGRCDPEALQPPAGLSERDVRRALDLERLLVESPDVPRERLCKIARVRERIRDGRYVTPVRLRTALRRALEDLGR